MRKRAHAQRGTCLVYTSKLEKNKCWQTQTQTGQTDRLTDIQRGGLTEERHKQDRTAHDLLVSIETIDLLFSTQCGERCARQHRNELPQEILLIGPFSNTDHQQVHTGQTDTNRHRQIDTDIWTDRGQTKTRQDRQRTGARQKQNRTDTRDTRQTIGKRPDRQGTRDKGMLTRRQRQRVSSCVGAGGACGSPVRLRGEQNRQTRRQPRHPNPSLTHSIPSRKIQSPECTTMPDLSPEASVPDHSRSQPDLSNPKTTNTQRNREL